MTAVGIDISKGRSTVAAVNAAKEVVLTPRDFDHTEIGLERLIYNEILALGGEVRVIMEATGRYHEPVAQALHEAGIFVCILNPLITHNYGNNIIRKVHSDKADARKIARYGIDHWVELREYTPLDSMRVQLKLISRQYNFYMKHVVQQQNNLIALSDKVFPGVNEIFTSPMRKDGHQKRVDFFATFWHADCISRVSQSSFTERYRKWCKRKGYNYSEYKAFEVYVSALGHYITLPKNAYAKLLITTACAQLTATLKNLAAIKAEMLRIATLMPEHKIVMSLYGVADVTAAQLMAEIGDVRNFDNRSSLIAYAGVDPSTSQSGKYESKSGKATKRGSAHLRKTLFQVVSTHLKRSPKDEAVYQFIDRKRAEGKHYFVYMTAGANKFLRIYYGIVKPFLVSIEKTNR